MGKFIFSSEKYKLLKALRKKIDKKKSTVMVGSRPVLNNDDFFLVCLSPNLMKRVDKLPVVFEGFTVVYEELEPFKEYTIKMDSIF